MTKTKKSTPFLRIYRKIVIGFVGLTVVLIGVIVFFTLVRADIEVKPRKTLQSVEFLIGLAESGQKETVSGRLEERLIEGEEQVETTGTKAKTGEVAGTLTIVNVTGTPQPLVATTRFLTPEGILFRLKNRVTVPAKGKIDAEVYPDKPLASAVAPTKWTIPGLNEAKQKLIWAESKMTIGGEGQMVRVAAADDLAKAKALVLQKLESEALKKFQDEVKSEFSGVTAKIISSETTLGAKDGEEKQNFSAHGKIKLVMAAFDRQALEDLAKTRLLLSMPEDKELISFDPKAIKISLDSYDLKGQSGTLRVYVDGEAILKRLSPILNVEKIAGMSIDDAKKYLESFEAIESVKVDIFPGWLKNIPTLKDHIEVIIMK